MPLRQFSLTLLLTAMMCGLVFFPPTADDDDAPRLASTKKSGATALSDEAKRAVTIAVYDAQRDAVKAAIAEFTVQLKAEGWSVDDDSIVPGGSGEWRYQVVLTATKPDVPPAICYVEVMAFVSHDERDSPTWLENLPMRISSRGYLLDKQFISALIPKLDARAWAYQEEQVVHRLHEFPALTPIIMKTKRREELLRFYHSLGVDFAARKYGAGPLHYVARIGPNAYELHAAPEAEAVDTTTLLSIHVDKLTEAIETLRATGTPIESEPAPSRWNGSFRRVADPGDDLSERNSPRIPVYKVATVRDPDGRLVWLSGY